MTTSTSDDSWCLIESDPGVFTELINKLGCKGVEVEELWSLDAEHFEHLKPIHGLIFLFKLLPNLKSEGSLEKDEKQLKHIFFAKQMVNNVCATQTLLSILLNCTHSDVDIGPTLRKFKNICKDLSPDIKGLAVANCEAIRNVHNSFANKHIWYNTEERPEEKKEEHRYHFVAYVPINGTLYEIDGLKSGPIKLAVLEKDVDWMDVVRPIILKKITNYDKDEIHFNLMVVISDLKVKYEHHLLVLEKSMKKVGKQYNESLKKEINRIQIMITEQDSKRQRYKQDNLRRQHNYLPLIITLMKMAGQEGHLVSLYEKAKSITNNLSLISREKENKTKECG